MDKQEYIREGVSETEVPLQEIPPAKKPRKKIFTERRVMAAVFLAPTVVSVVFFKYYMSASSLFSSLFNYDYANPPGQWVGLLNYINVFQSSMFWQQLWNTVALYLLGLVFGFWVPIVQALLLNEVVKGKAVMRYLFVLPAAIPSVASMTLWRFIWEPDGGLANFLVTLFGGKAQTWLLDENWIKFCLTFPSIRGGGLNILIYLVAIESVDESILEAARLDGATRFQVVLRIILPNIAYMIGVQFLLSLSSSLLAFDNVYVMTDGTGGPNGSAKTLVFGIYSLAYERMQYGQAMATSIVVVIITLLFVGLKQFIQKRVSKAD